MVMSCDEPSASCCNWVASEMQIWVRATVKSSWLGETALAPDAISVTWSFVDMQPSESRRSKVTRVAARSAWSRDLLSITASVVITTSMVARPGASMPAPFAIPPIDQPSACLNSAVLGFESVVIIAWAAIAPLVELRFATAAEVPARSFSRSSWSPINPVEQTSTSPALSPSSSATFSAVACVVWKPSAPV